MNDIKTIGDIFKKDEVSVLEELGFEICIDVKDLPLEYEVDKERLAENYE